MDQLIQAIEIFAFVTGIAYIVLEIGQKRLMWTLGILTGVACAFSFAVQHLYASMGLNVYYVIMSFVGLNQWKKDEAKLSGKSSIHLCRLGMRTAIASAVIFVAGSFLLCKTLQLLGGAETWMDAVTTVMSAVAAWWLVKSYPQQWLVWIVADLFSTTLCIVSGMYWMAVLYFVYAASAVYGYIHWRRNGETVG